MCIRDSLRAAANFINNGRYQEAMNVLNGINEHTAQWYYYSAIANSGLDVYKRQLLIATVRALWCLAQFPVILLGRIFPLSEMYFLNFAVSCLLYTSHLPCYPSDSFILIHSQYRFSFIGMCLCNI